MGSRPANQRLCGINLQAPDKFSCLTLVLNLKSMNHSAGSIQALPLNWGTASSFFAIPLDLEGLARARAEMWSVSLSDAVSVRDELYWVF